MNVDQAEGAFLVATGVHDRSCILRSASPRGEQMGGFAWVEEAGRGIRPAPSLMVT